MPGGVFLRDDRVVLRTIEDEDVDFLQRMINDPRVRGGLSTCEPLDRDDEREWVESIGDGGGIHLLVCVDGDPVGTVGLRAIHDGWGTAEIGYWLAPDHWGEGYATAAATLVTEYAFAERRLAKLWARVVATNSGSRRVLERVGFEEEARLREHAFVDGERVDVYRYGLLASEFDG